MLPINFYMQGDMIATHRIMAFRMTIGIFQNPEIARLFVVIKNYFLVERAGVVHQANTFFTL